MTPEQIDLYIDSLRAKGIRSKAALLKIRRNLERAPAPRPIDPEMLAIAKRVLGSQNTFF